MKPDLYTKVILTVIAVCLVWICIRDVTFSNRAIAQIDQVGQRVYITGIAQGVYFPVAITSIGRGQLFDIPNSWQPLPVSLQSPTPTPSPTPR